MEQTPNISLWSRPLKQNLWPPSDLHRFVNHVENAPKSSVAQTRGSPTHIRHTDAVPRLWILMWPRKNWRESPSQLRPPPRVAEGILTAGWRTRRAYKRKDIHYCYCYCYCSCCCWWPSYYHHHYYHYHHYFTFPYSYFFYCYLHHFSHYHHRHHHNPFSQLQCVQLFATLFSSWIYVYCPDEWLALFFSFVLSKGAE